MRLLHPSPELRTREEDFSSWASGRDFFFSWARVEWDEDGYLKMEQGYS
jgi:hypothetical protein